MAIPLKPFERMAYWSGTVCPLTSGELRALWALARFGTYEAAGREIGCSRSAVKNTLNRARHKLGIKESVTAVVYAIERNWLPPMTLDNGFSASHTGP